MQPTSLELCAGAGGQALGLELAGFDHECLVEIDDDACRTLRANRPEWNVHQGDLREFSGSSFKGVDLLAGGLPCPPFSVAGKQLGELDERNLFPAAFDIIADAMPKAILIENVKGLSEPRFSDYRENLRLAFQSLGYVVDWTLISASDVGVSQLRPRFVIVALQSDIADKFSWPTKGLIPPKSVGEKLFDLMAENGWPGAARWARQADSVAPTIVGGSKKHGGPDLGPTRAKQAWEKLGVNGKGIADHAPTADFVGLPKLTVRMVARLQGFPDNWSITGRKTAAYRQVGNAFPPPVAEAVGRQILEALGHNVAVEAVA